MKHFRTSEQLLKHLPFQNKIQVYAKPVVMRFHMALLNDQRENKIRKIYTQMFSFLREEKRSSDLILANTRKSQ